jgi:hypothetical protein
MTPNELFFHRTLLDGGHGGIYNYTNAPLHPHSLMCKAFVTDTLQMASEFRASNLYFKPFPDLFAGIAACDELNAGAFKDTENPVYYISLCKGSIDLLLEFFRRLACIPSVFPWMGGLPPVAPAPAFPPFPHVSTFIERDYVAHPIEWRRFAASAWMLDNALKFLRLHELRHVIGGHIDYSIKYFGVNDLHELARINPDRSRENLVRQAFEIEADCSAAIFLLGFYFSSTPTLTFDLDFLAECDDKREKVLIMLLTSVLAVIKLLGDEMPSHGKWDDYDHPPNVVRATSILRFAQSHLEQWGHTDLTSRQDAIDEIMVTVNNHIHNLLGHPPFTDEWRRGVEIGGEFDIHSQNLVNVRKSIHRDVQACAYICIPDP